MDIGKSFSFVFQDDRWITKLLIAAGILLVGVVLGILIVPAIVAAALLMGYAVEITRRVINGTQPLLPEWDNWQTLIVDGLKVLVIVIVYALPAILVSACLGIPAAILRDNQGYQTGWSALLNTTSSCLSFLWSIVLGLVLPAAVAFFAVDGQLASAFRFSDVIAFVRKNIQNYLVVLVISWAAWLVATIAGSLVCGIGLLATIPYAYMVIGHLYGEAYAESRGAAVAPVVGDQS